MYAAVPYSVTVYCGKDIKRAAVLITAGDGTVTGLKMWNKNCTPTTYLWVI
jgi:hypothetical protein